MIDVFVIGGGPAGATTARLLASWGWSVVVANRTRTARPSLGESLPPSTRKLLAFLGQLEEVDASGFHPNAGNIAWWAGESRVTNTDGPGFHVPRAEFDSVLRQSARQSGALIVDALVRSVQFGDPIQIEYVTVDGHVETCHARRLLDCSGRAGVIARGLRREQPRYRTLAITMEWECNRASFRDRAHTLVESYADGWAWSVPLSDRRRQCTVMVDPALCGDLAGTSNLGRIYTRELAKARALAACLADARRVSEPWACNASLYHAPRPAEAGALLVGDAASFIEPLSSAGVKKALASAWRAAVVTNTSLARPGMADAATDFYIKRESDVCADCQRISGRFFREAAAAYRHPFWLVRAESAACTDGDDRRTAEELVRDPGVRAAFEELRRAPLVRLRPASGLKLEPTATIEGREVVMRDGLALPGVRAPLRFAAGINLPALVGLASHCDEMSSLISAYRAEVGPAPIQGLLTGVSLLVAHRRLINEGSAS